MMITNKITKCPLCSPKEKHAPILRPYSAYQTYCNFDSCETPHILINESNEEYNVVMLRLNSYYLPYLIITNTKTILCARSEGNSSKLIKLDKINYLDNDKIEELFNFLQGIKLFQ